MKKKSAFTLVELLIVIAVLMSLSGLISTQWIYLERITKSIHEHIQFTYEGKRVIGKLSNDIAAAIEITKPEGILLELKQKSIEGKEILVTYRKENGEIIRSETRENAPVFTEKILTLHEYQLLIDFDKNQMIKIEIMKPGNQNPLSVKDRKIITYVAKEF